MAKKRGRRSRKLSGTAALVRALQDILPLKVKRSTLTRLVTTLQEQLHLGKPSGVNASLAGLQDQMQRITQALGILTDGGVRAMDTAIGGVTQASNIAIDGLSDGLVEGLDEGIEAVGHGFRKFNQECGLAFNTYQINLEAASNTLRDA